MKYTTLLFDLDGTLTDSGPGIMNCVKYMLEHYGITEYTEAQLRACVGPPLTESFMRFWGFDYPTALEAVEVYRERYKPVGIFENSVYDGIPEALCAFRDAGARLYVATSKPTFMAERVLEHFGLREYFTKIAGATEDERLNRKDDIIEDLLLRLNLSPEERRRCVMIGDRKYDVAGGRKFGLDTVGVYYGYAEAGELEAAGATHVVDTVEALRTLLLA